MTNHKYLIIVTFKSLSNTECDVLLDNLRKVSPFWQSAKMLLFTSPNHMGNYIAVAPGLHI